MVLVPAVTAVPVSRVKVVLLGTAMMVEVPWPAMPLTFMPGYRPAVLPTVTVALAAVVVPWSATVVLALVSIAPKVSVEVALAPTAAMAEERVTVVPLTLATVVPGLMPKPVTDMPAAIPAAVAAGTVTVVAAAVTLMPEAVTPTGTAVNVTFDVLVAVGAVDKVTVLPVMLLIVVPGAMPRPLTYMPTERPVAESTGRLVLPLLTFATCDTVLTPVGGPKIRPLVPATVGAADKVKVVPDTLRTVVLAASVPVPPAASVTVDPGMMLVPAGTVIVVPVVNVWLPSTWATG